MADNNLSKLVESALSNLRTMTDADTIIGKPMEVTGGSTIIPVSKVTVGFTSGGVDYMSKANPDKAPNFGGGTGTGYTVTPIAFLVVDFERPAQGVDALPGFCCGVLVDIETQDVFACPIFHDGYGFNIVLLKIVIGEIDFPEIGSSALEMCVRSGE